MENAKRKMQNGFTLFETLVVITVISIIFVVAGQILLTTLRGVSKSEVTSRAKQEAQNVLSVMERELHNARSIVAGQCGGGSVHYITPIGVEAWFFYDSDAKSIKHHRADGTEIALTTGNVEVPTAPTFLCTADLKSVEISLTLGNKTTSTRPEDVSSVTLKTRILLRN